MFFVLVYRGGNYPKQISLPMIIEQSIEYSKRGISISFSNEPIKLDSVSIAHADQRHLLATQLLSSYKQESVRYRLSRLEILLIVAERPQKCLAIVDTRGIPLSITYYPANCSDFHTIEQSVANTLIPLIPRSTLYADKGYDSQSARQRFRSYGLNDSIGKRETQTSSSKQRRTRRCLNIFLLLSTKLAAFVLRYDRYLSSYNGFVMLRSCHLLATRI